jgi:hypothetical protein
VETFVIRVWVPAAPEPQAPLRGIVEHVGTHWSAAFGDGEELLASLGSWVGREPSGHVVDSKTGGKT